MAHLPVLTEKAVLIDTVDLAGDHRIRFSAIMSVFLSLLLTLRNCARSRAVPQLEMLALRHQLQVLQRSRPQRLRLAQATACCGYGCHVSGTSGVRRSSSSNRKPSSPGTAAPSAHTGAGRVVAGSDDLRCLPRSER
jgi:hypothetical protein